MYKRQIRECCKYGKKFEREGIQCSISINIPAQVLLHKDFLKVINYATRESNLEASKLDFEIVESALHEDMDRVTRVIRLLHSMGMEVSVDDFGTGFSSISYLKKMSIDRIKIDRTLTSKINQDEDGTSIVNAIISVSKSLNMTVSAEGVENEMQYEFLKKAECDEIQGYFITPPLPSDEFIEFVN